MTPEQFAYWMQGFAELSPCPPSPEQWQSIRDHLELVFKKVTPKAKEAAAKPADHISFEEMLKKAQEDAARRTQQDINRYPYAPNGIGPQWAKPMEIYC